MSSKKNPQEYWATQPTIDFIPEFHSHVGEYYTNLNDTGRLERWQRNNRHYYGQGTSTNASSNRLTSTGDAGEYTTLKINDYRSIVNHAVILTLQGRPALQCRAANTDVKSKQEVQLGNCIVEYHLKQERIEKNLKQATIFAMLYDEAYTLRLWNPNAGDIVRIQPEQYETDEATGEPLIDETTGQPKVRIPARPIRTGKLEHHVFGPYDVVRDPRLRNAKASWYAFRMQFSRWDMIANFPAFRDKLLAVNNESEYTPSTYQFITPLVSSTDADLIDGWVFVHEKTAAAPNGRFAIIFGDFAVTDTGLPYKKMPVGRVAPGEQDQTSHGYSDANDLVAIQELRDAMVSVIASNEITFGGQNIAVKKGWGGSRTQLGASFNLFELENPATDIMPLNLLRTSPELFKFNEYLDQKQGQLLGVNPTVRGNPQENIKSGSFAALQDSKAIQFLSGLQESYNQLLEGEGQGIIEILQDYADEPQMVAIAGKSNRSYLKQFKYTKGDISKIVRVQVESVNPLSQTPSGRLQIAQDLLVNGHISRPEQYLQVLETGRLEPLYGDDLAPLLMIDEENEALQEARPVIALITDRHREHVESHASLLNDPDTRINDPDLRERVQQHIFEHLKLLAMAAQQNPMLLWALKQEMPPMGPQVPGGPPPGPGTPRPPGASPAPASLNPKPGGEEKEQRQPSMPTNPATGQKAPTPPGQGNPAAS